MGYEHRMMRCKLDRSAMIGERRYRPGEVLQDGHEPTEAFEEFTPPPVVVQPVKPMRKLQRLVPLRQVPGTPEPPVVSSGPPVPDPL